VCVCLHVHVSFQYVKQLNDYDFRAPWYEHYSIRGYDIFIHFNFIQLVVTAWRRMKFWARIDTTATQFRNLKLCNFEKYSSLIKRGFLVKLWRHNITVVCTKFLLSYPIINIACIFLPYLYAFLKVITTTTLSFVFNAAVHFRFLWFIVTDVIKTQYKRDYLVQVYLVNTRQAKKI
jgi:hypothetical protein